jgi:hypothetical protein
VNTVATDIADVTTVADDIANVNTVAGNTANIDIVAGINADVTTVASIEADVQIVADNVADITNFSDVYQGPKSTPPTLRNDGGALQLGDLYFNTVSNAMFVYASTGWVPAGSSVNGTSRRFRYIATAGQTTFTGTDSNGNTMAYDAGFVDVYLNGVRLDETDYTASSGDSIVLGSAAALNDELNIVAFGTFAVADINGVDIVNGTVTANKFGSDAPLGVSDKANTSTGYMMMPVGTSAQRPGTPAAGMYRMNTDTGNPEWYDSVSETWIQFSLGAPYLVEYIVVAGGAGGGGSAGSSSTGGGGGGAGGYRSSVVGENSGGGASAESRINVVGGSNYTVTIGAGGAGGAVDTIGTNGSTSLFSTISSVGGGGGARGTASQTAASGGSGGGGGYQGFGAAGTTGQGYAGGGTGVSDTTASGGGGAGQVGANGVSRPGLPGNGGNGVASSITGSSVTRAGGGGAGTLDVDSSSGGTGGLGGGGNGGSTSVVNGTAGTANTGGGGGGAARIGSTGYSGSAGGSGIVIIRYLGAQRGAGGTVTSSGGYTYHTFTSSGTFTA